MVQSQPGQKVSETLIVVNKPRLVIYAYKPHYAGGIGRKIKVQGQLWAKCETLSKK
jgi:hypothetical protein